MWFFFKIKNFFTLHPQPSNNELIKLQATSNTDEDEALRNW